MKDGRATRNNLICAASRLAHIKGFDRTSVQEVMEGAGAGKGSFYYHFESKDELGLAVLEQYRASFMEMLSKCLDRKNGFDALDCFFNAALEKHRSTGFTGGCLWGNTALEMSDSNPAFVEPVNGVFHEWTEKVRKAIAEAQADGVIRNDASDSDLAVLVVSAIEGGIMLSRLRKDEQALRTCLDLLRLVLRSFSNGSPLKKEGRRDTEH